MTTFLFFVLLPSLLFYLVLCLFENSLFFLVSIIFFVLSTSRFFIFAPLSYFCTIPPLAYISHHSPFCVSFFVLPPLALLFVTLSFLLLIFVLPPLILFFVYFIPKSHNLIIYFFTQKVKHLNLFPFQFI